MADAIGKDPPQPLDLPADASDDAVEQLVWKQLRTCFDPEIPINIVELGLVYDVEVAGPRVKVLYSLTSMGCPAGPLIQQNIEEVVRSLPEVEEVETELTFDRDIGVALSSTEFARYATAFRIFRIY